MTRQLTTVYVQADSSGTLARIPGDYSNAPYLMPRSPDLTNNTVLYLTGDTYSVEYDSTGEIYVVFSTRAGEIVSGVVLLVRGMSVNITADVLTIVGVRRAGTVRITAGSAGGSLELTNSPSGLGDTFMQYYPVGTNGTTGPAGWNTIAGYGSQPNSFVTYNPSKSLNVSGVFGGSARRFNSGAPTAGSYYLLQYGYADVQDDTIIRFWPYYDRVVDTASSSGTYSVDAQAHWKPAVFWILTASGVIANAATVDLKIESNTTYTFKRAGVSTLLDHT